MAEAARRPGTYLHNVLGIMGLVARMLGCFRGEVTYPLASSTFQLVERTSQQTSCDRVDMLELVIFDLSKPLLMLAQESNLLASTVHVGCATPPRQQPC
jgi:hypothetical protein